MPIVLQDANGAVGSVGGRGNVKLFVKLTGDVTLLSSSSGRLCAGVALVSRLERERTFLLGSMR